MRIPDQQQRVTFSTIGFASGLYYYQLNTGSGQVGYGKFAVNH